MTALLIVVVLHMTSQGLTYDALMHKVGSMGECDSIKQKIEGTQGKEFVIPLCVPIGPNEKVMI